MGFFISLICKLNCMGFPNDPSRKIDQMLFNICVLNFQDNAQKLISSIGDQHTACISSRLTRSGDQPWSSNQIRSQSQFWIPYIFKILKILQLQPPATLHVFKGNCLGDENPKLLRICHIRTIRIHICKWVNKRGIFFLIVERSKLSVDLGSVYCIYLWPTKKPPDLKQELTHFPVLRPFW